MGEPGRGQGKPSQRLAPHDVGWDLVWTLGAGTSTPVRQESSSFRKKPSRPEPASVSRSEAIAASSLRGQ